MDERIATIESTNQNIANKLDGFATQIVDCFSKVDVNDASLKQELKDQFGILDTGYKAANTEIQQTMSNLQGVITARNIEIASMSAAQVITNQDHIEMQQEQSKLRDERISPMEAEVVKIRAELGNYHTGMAAKINTSETELKSLNMEVGHLKTAGSSGATQASQEG